MGTWRYILYGDDAAPSYIKGLLPLLVAVYVYVQDKCCKCTLYMYIHVHLDVDIYWLVWRSVLSKIIHFCEYFSSEHRVCTHHFPLLFNLIVTL